MARKNISVTNQIVSETLGSSENASKLIETAILFYLKYANEIDKNGFITQEDLRKAIMESNSQKNRDIVYKEIVNYTLML